MSAAARSAPGEVSNISHMPASPRLTALVVEDDPSIREVIRLHLELAGFDVQGIADGKAGLDLARRTKFDLLTLDVMLPGLDGVTLCRAVRAEGASREAAILMVTARDGESDTVLGLESGADDYLAKPFGVRELVARVAAVTRRLRRGEREPAGSPGDKVVTPSVTLDPATRSVVVRGTAIDLTKQEFDVLHALASRRGIVFSRTALLQAVWKNDDFVTERTVDAVISRLRRKVERDARDPELLLTAWGVGYKFVDAG